MWKDTKEPEMDTIYEDMVMEKTSNWIELNVKVNRVLNPSSVYVRVVSLIGNLFAVGHWVDDYVVK